MKFSLKPMESEDIPQVVEIEGEAFPETRPPTPFEREARNPMAAYLVAWQPSPRQGNGETPRGELASKPGRSLWSKLFLRPGGQAHGQTGEAKGSVLIGGYVALWFPPDEAHINSIAVRKSLRGQGLGELLLMGAIELAMARSCRVVTLEVRASNAPAQKLYEKYGFRQGGLRKGYYVDNHEDAWIMTTDPIQSQEYRQSFQELVTTFLHRRGEVARLLPS